tara:strand:+ start:528 stop:650 length:123 start_codon:yes stop_codon:yes gene_type:complete
VAVDQVQKDLEALVELVEVEPVVTEPLVLVQVHYKEQRKV